jgi:hypothetical protein
MGQYSARTALSKLPGLAIGLPKSPPRVFQGDASQSLRRGCALGLPRLGGFELMKCDCDTARLPRAWRYASPAPRWRKSPSGDDRRARSKILQLRIGQPKLLVDFQMILAGGLCDALTAKQHFQRPAIPSGALGRRACRQFVPLFAKPLSRIDVESGGQPASLSLFLPGQNEYFSPSWICRIAVCVLLMIPKFWCALVPGWPGNAAPERIFRLGMPQFG